MVTFLPGYNTNGFAHHRLDDAIGILADLGYRSIALTLDVHHLDPFARDFEKQTEQVHQLLQRCNLRCVIETGARFLLDACRKHQPTLLSDDPARRIDFLERSIDLASRLGADAVSFWSGTPERDLEEPVLWQRLIDSCRRLCDHAESRGVRLAFEPEPGMFIDTMPRFERLFQAVDRGCFGLTLDVGHLHCQRETPMTPHLQRWRDRLWNIHIEDMKPGVHDHLLFGEGDLDFAELFAGLRSIDYRGGLHVELSRHSHDAVRVAERSMQFLASHG